MVRIFRNYKSNFIRKISKRNDLKIFNKSIVKTTTKIANIYRITFNNNNCINNIFSKFLLINAKDKIIY